MLKKEMFSLKARGKEGNRERAFRRQEFEVEKLEEKLENDRQRYDAMVTERRRMKSVTLKTLVESEI